PSEPAAVVETWTTGASPAFVTHIAYEVTESGVLGCEAAYPDVVVHEPGSGLPDEVGEAPDELLGLVPRITAPSFETSPPAELMRPAPPATSVVPAGQFAVAVNELKLPAEGGIEVVAVSIAAVGVE